MFEFNYIVPLFPSFDLCLSVCRSSWYLILGSVLGFSIVLLDTREEKCTSGFVLTVLDKEDNFISIRGGRRQDGVAETAVF